jgi:hypothetical protein
MSYREFGINYDPAVGFAPRVGFRRLQPTVTFAPLISSSKLIRELSWSYDFEYLMQMNWKPLTVNHELTLLGIRFETGDVLQFGLLHNYEYLDDDFDILRDGRFVIPVGDYKNIGYTIGLETAGFRRLGGSFSYRKTEFWTGTQDNFTADVFIRPTIGLNMSASYAFSKVKLAEGDFDTHLIRLITGYDFSPWVSVNVNLQYDNVTRFLGANNRFTWVINPGNTLFVVYNHNWQKFDERIISMEHKLNIKLAYTFRF